MEVHPSFISHTVGIKVIEFPLLEEIDVETPRFVFHKTHGHVLGIWEPETKNNPSEWKLLEPPPKLRPEKNEFAFNCDECKSKITLPNTHYRCTSCKDFDLCSQCYEKGTLKANHDVNHKFMHMSKPTIVKNINCVCCGNWCTGIYANHVIKDTTQKFAICSECYKQKLREFNKNSL